jgi:hypothetical protein
MNFDAAKSPYIPARNPLLLARFVNDPLPRDDSPFPRDDDHSRDVPHTFVTDVFDQAAGEKLIGHAPDGCWMNRGQDAPAMLDQVDALLSHAPAAHGLPPSMRPSAVSFPDSSCAVFARFFVLFARIFAFRSAFSRSGAGAQIQPKP